MNMKINSRIVEILTEFNIRQEDGICYLISLFHGYEPTYIPEHLKVKVNMTGIIENEQGTAKWNIPLYDGVETAFGWVEEKYVKLFAVINKDSNGRQALVRMKRLFAANPDIRVEEVLGATEMYIRNTERTYVRLPHYFIEKGKGVEKTQDILDWIDKYRISNQQRGTSNYNTLE